jgi:hypothetical protein
MQQAVGGLEPYPTVGFSTCVMPAGYASLSYYKHYPKLLAITWEHTHNLQMNSAHHAITDWVADNRQCRSPDYNT